MSTAAQTWSGDPLTNPSPLASPISRVIAYFFDTIIVLGVAVALVKGIGFVSAYLLAVVFVQLLYFAAFEGSRLRASPGKLLLGLRVVSTSGGAVSFGRALARNLAKSVTATFGFLFRLLFSLGGTRRHHRQSTDPPTRRRL